MNTPLSTPEFRRFWLKNNVNDTEVLVTDYDLQKAFSQEELRRIYSNRHYFFYVEEYFEDSETL